MRLHQTLSAVALPKDSGFVPFHHERDHVGRIIGKTFTKKKQLSSQVLQMIRETRKGVIPRPSQPFLGGFSLPNTARGKSEEKPLSTLFRCDLAKDRHQRFGKSHVKLVRRLKGEQIKPFYNRQNYEKFYFKKTPCCRMYPRISVELASSRDVSDTSILCEKKKTVASSQSGPVGQRKIEEFNQRCRQQLQQISDNDQRFQLKLHEDVQEGLRQTKYKLEQLRISTNRLRSETSALWLRT